MDMQLIEYYTDILSSFRVVCRLIKEVRARKKIAVGIA